jgi:hypothetical protein
LTRGGMAVNPVAIAVRAERHKRLRRGEKIAHPSRMDSGIAPTDHSALMDAHQDSQLHRNHLRLRTTGGRAPHREGFFGTGVGG